MSFSPRSSLTSNSNPQQQQQQQQQQQHRPDEFSARRSNRVSNKKFSADNDVWVENLAVVEMASPQAQASAQTSASSDANADASQTPQLTLRSYFQSKATNQRVWDEPPSGASQVVYASEHVRQMAEIQMQDLQVSTEVIRGASTAAAASSAERSGEGNNTRGGSKSNKPRVLAKFKIGRKNSCKADTDDADVSGKEKEKSRERRKIRYKPGRAPYGATAAYDQSNETAQLEFAKMLSLKDVECDSDYVGGNGQESIADNAGRNGIPSNWSGDEERAMIDMAVAISLSEAEAAKAELSPMAESMRALKEEDDNGCVSLLSESGPAGGHQSLRYRGSRLDDDKKLHPKNEGRHIW